jgi:hypothetical protein
MVLPRRRVAPLLLVCLLIAGPLAAATHRPQEAWQSRLSVSELVSEAWVLVSRILGKSGGSNDPFGKAGSYIDPFGNLAPTSQPPSNSASTDPASGK